MLHNDPIISDFLAAKLDRNLRVQLHDSVFGELLPVSRCKLAEVLSTLFKFLVAEGSLDVEV